MNLQQIKNKVAKKYGYYNQSDTEFIKRMHLYVDEIAVLYASQFKIKEIVNKAEKTLKTFDINDYHKVSDMLPKKTMEVDIVIKNKTFCRAWFFKDLTGEIRENPSGEKVIPPYKILGFATGYRMLIQNVTHWKEVEK